MEACFKAGMSAIFKEDHGTVMPWLDMLERATESGHDLATYVFSLALYKSNSGAANDATAWRLLRKLEGDKEVPAAKTARWKKQTYARCHRAIRVVLLDDLVLPHHANEACSASSGLSGALLGRASVPRRRLRRHHRGRRSMGDVGPVLQRGV